MKRDSYADDRDCSNENGCREELTGSPRMTQDDERDDRSGKQPPASERHRGVIKYALPISPVEGRTKAERDRNS